MTKQYRTPKVRHRVWTENGKQVPMIRISSGPAFLMIPYDKARQIVDQVHDLCDDHEREQRQQTRHQ